MEHWLDYLFGIIVSMVSWFAVRLWKRMDKAEERQNAMQLNCVTRADFQQSMDGLRTDRRAMHEENKTDLREIKSSVKDIDSTVRTVALQVAGLTPSRRSRN